MPIPAPSETSVALGIHSNRIESMEPVRDNNMNKQTMHVQGIDTNIDTKVHDGTPKTREQGDTAVVPSAIKKP